MWEKNQGARVKRRYDIRPKDFHTGKKMAVDTADMEECQCCGRKIFKIVELVNGYKIGTRCHEYVKYPQIMEDGLAFEKRSGQKSKLTKSMKEFFKLIGYI